MQHAEIEELARKRQKWVDANRENDFEEGIKNLLTELYPDNAHFIYELLQNAEDPKAKKVKFNLKYECIEFEHDGERLFNINDVTAITSIGKSTKRDDHTNIGKFGVGFKSVFTYTNTPQIHSGDFHFYIKDLVVPVATASILLGNKTKFILPFDTHEKQPTQAIEEIQRGLTGLRDNTLLFLNNIQRIEYYFPCGKFGYLEKINLSDRIIEIRVVKPTGERHVSHWLMYYKTITVCDEEEKNVTCQVAVAFRLQRQFKDEKVKKKKKKKIKDFREWKIVPLELGQVSIYFPAENETSNLRFHIHAPFASTVARDSVRDCEANNVLRDAIATCVSSSLQDICKRGLLTMDFLSVLPNEADSLPLRYEPIRNSIIHSFQRFPITPTRSGKYAPSTALFRGPAKISEVINDSDISLLMDLSHPLWAANPPQQNQREDRFLDSLSIKTWGWDELLSIFKINNLEKRKQIEVWISEKSDAWLVQFYALLYEVHEKKDFMKYINNIPIVRVEKNNSIEHVIAQSAYFKPECEIDVISSILFVKKSVYKTGKSESQSKASELLLKYIGVRDYDERAMIELVLLSYKNFKKLAEFETDHYNHLIQFVNHWKLNTYDVNFFQNYSFLLGAAQDGSLFWCKPEELCIDMPYLDTGLSEISVVHGKKPIWNGYASQFDEAQLNNFISFLKSIGVTFGLNVSCVRVNENPNLKNLWEGLTSYNRDTSTGVNQDYIIEFLDRYISFQTISASKAIWNCLLSANSMVSKARYRPNQQHSIRETDSQLVYYLKNNAWIPDKIGRFCNPQSMTRDDLRSDFPYDDRNGLLTSVMFGENAKKVSEEYIQKNKSVRELGFESTEDVEKLLCIANLAKEMGITFDSIIEQLRPCVAQQSELFPSRPLANPERRSERFEEQLAAAPTKEYATRERSVRITSYAIDPTTWLRSQYTNNDAQMICQICKREMPFRKRDGNYYFEKKEVLSHKHLPKEHEAQYLALCPLCAAKYEEFVKSVDDAMTELRESIVCTENGEIPILLGDEKTTIRFEAPHFHDLKIILNNINEQRGDDGIS